MLSREQILLNNLQEVQNSVESACSRAGRSPQEVTLLVVTKYAKDEDVLALLKTGQITDIGESRLQQACKRWQENPSFAPFGKVRKHFIGHLQKNKAAKAAQFFDFLDSLDDFETAALVAKHLPKGKVMRVLVQIKLTDRDTQNGLPLEEARQLVARLKAAQIPGLKVCGYMAIAPQGASIAQLRALFSRVKKAFDADFSSLSEKYLSLGMSEDFVTAVEEGSSLPRIGSRLFANHLEEV